MAAKIETWSDAALRRYLLYSAAAIAAVPAALAYAALATHQLENWWTVLLTLLAGVVLAHLGWRYAAHRLPGWSRTRDTVARESPTLSTSFRWTPPDDNGSSVTVGGIGPALVGVGVLSWILLGLFIWNWKQAFHL